MSGKKAGNKWAKCVHREEILNINNRIRNIKFFFLLPLGLFLLAAVGLLAQTGSPTPLVRIGSKTFTESVILGEMAAHLVHQAGARPEHRQGLGGTRVLWDALRSGAIDLYPEYTGTLIHGILARENLDGDEARRRVLAAHGLKMTAALGFNNNYAIGMTRETCQKFGISWISDLRRYPAGNPRLRRGPGSAAPGQTPAH